MILWVENKLWTIRNVQQNDESSPFLAVSHLNSTPDYVEWFLSTDMSDK